MPLPSNPTPPPARCLLETYDEVTGQRAEELSQGGPQGQVFALFHWIRTALDPLLSSSAPPLCQRKPAAESVRADVLPQRVHGQLDRGQVLRHRVQRGGVCRVDSPCAEYTMRPHLLCADVTVEAQERKAINNKPIKKATVFFLCALFGGRVALTMPISIWGEKGKFGGTPRHKNPDGMGVG